VAGRVDLDLYNVLLGFGWARERRDLLRATIDPSFLLRARRALFPCRSWTGSDRSPPMCCRLFASVRCAASRAGA
jgi:hypothetical protein